MQFLFYTNSAQEQILDKTSYLSSETTLTGQIKNECNVLTPTLIINANVFDSNYVYMPLFKRYYFITSFTRLDNNRLEISCSVDVLMSFKTEIKNYDVIATRSSNNYNALIVDRAISTQNNYFVITKKISEGLFASNTLNVEDYTYALTVINKKGVSE